MIVAGCDIGSLTGKFVVMRDGEMVSSAIVQNSTRPDKTARRVMGEAMANTYIQEQDIQYLIFTGYGRAKVTWADANVSEITCHAKGVHWLIPTTHTVIDIGGQDCKVISLNSSGKVCNFAMNDKCAAGTGRFLENMARALELGLEEMGPLALEGTSPAVISSQCSVFAESEVITLLAEGTPMDDIVAGVHKSIAGRIAGMVRKMGIEPDLTLVGGVAKNPAVTRFLEIELGQQIKQLPVDPQLAGAIGAALIAWERMTTQHA